MMNEICKSKLTPKKTFWLVLLYIFCAMCFFNLTVGKINLLACDILTLISICIGVYVLYRFSVISYRYILDDESFSIYKIAGKNNEQIQIKLEYENILGVEKYIKKEKGVLNYCANLKKSDAYILKACLDGKEYNLIFEPTNEFLNELLLRTERTNEKI